MKCISLHQPYATFCALEIKLFETRSWKPWESLLGQRIAIHASKTQRTLKLVRAYHDYEVHLQTMRDREMNRCLDAVDWDEAPFGAVIATACIAYIMATDGPQREDITLRELTLGDWTPGRYAWRLAEVQRIEPVPLKGQQGIFDVSDTLIANAV